MTIDFIGYVLHKLRHSDVATVLRELTPREREGGWGSGYSHIWARQICAAW